MHQQQDGVTNNYPHRSFTTGRRHIPQTKSRPKGNSQTLKQPGKINLKDFSNVTDVISRMAIGEKDEHGKLSMGHAPLATPEMVDLGSEYAQVRGIAVMIVFGFLLAFVFMLFFCFVVSITKICLVKLCFSKCRFRSKMSYRTYTHITMGITSILWCTIPLGTTSPSSDTGEKRDSLVSLRLVFEYEQSYFMAL